jgi:hypothetical protein
MPLGNKNDGNTKTIFTTYSQGVLTARDSWAYNFSSSCLAANMSSMIAFYDEQVAVYAKALKNAKGEPPSVEDVIDLDARKISWTHNVKDDVRKRLCYQRVARSHIRLFARVPTHEGGQRVAPKDQSESRTAVAVAGSAPSRRITGKKVEIGLAHWGAGCACRSQLAPKPPPRKFGGPPQELRKLWSEEIQVSGDSGVSS